MEKTKVTSVKNQAIWTRKEFQNLIDDLIDEGKIPEEAGIFKITVEAEEPAVIEYHNPRRDI